MAVTRATLLSDLRTRYDLGSTEKTDKLNQFINETIRDISNEIPGAFNLRVSTLTLDANGEMTLDLNVDQVLIAYFNSVEIPILGLDTLTMWQQENFYNDYAITVKLDTDTGAFILSSNGLGTGAQVTVVHTVRVDDIDHVPASYKDVLFYGAAYKYEKFDLRLLPQEYKVTYNEYDRRLTLLRSKNFNQLQLTKKLGGSNVVERLKEVL